MKLAATIVSAIIAEATAARTAKPEEPKKEKNPRAEAIQAVFNGKEPFGCHTKQAAALVEAMTGVKVNYTPNNRVPQFHVVVPLSNENSGHSHTIGKPIISLELAEGRCLSMEGAGKKSYVEQSEVRAATDEEFKAMMDYLDANPVTVYEWITNNFRLSGVFPVS